MYTGYLGDGDSKSYHTVASADPPIYPENDAKNRISLYQKKVFKYALFCIVTSFCVDKYN